MQHKLQHTNRYNTNGYNPANHGDGGTPYSREAGGRGLEPECFICGRHESKSIRLRIIRRWKIMGRSVSLIIDTVCSTCDDKHKLISSNPNKHARN
ncbi:MAG TPA: hypothetical protein PKE39_04325 [Ignavibacteria bacterium]|nr:hypothetical protein [Ignavibacteria bacterium]